METAVLPYQKPPKRKAYRVRLVFSSGSKQFLNDLADSISKFTGIRKKNIYQQRGSFSLIYYKTAALKILKFMYSETEKNNLYLDRKYKRYLYLLRAERERLKT